MKNVILKIRYRFGYFETSGKVNSLLASSLTLPVFCKIDIEVRELLRKQLEDCIKRHRREDVWDDFLKSIKPGIVPFQ